MNIDVLDLSEADKILLNAAVDAHLFWAITVGNEVTDLSADQCEVEGPNDIAVWKYTDGAWTFFRGCRPRVGLGLLDDADIELLKAAAKASMYFAIIMDEVVYAVTSERPNNLLAENPRSVLWTWSEGDWTTDGT